MLSQYHCCAAQDPRRLTSYVSLAANAWSQDRAGKLRSVSTRLQGGAPGEHSEAR